jgi:antitoxin MazE
MKASIIAIGNSQGIRIPKALLAESGLSGEVELELTKEGILIRPCISSRVGWEEAFRGAAETDDFDDELVNTSLFERKEWRW